MAQMKLPPSVVRVLSMKTSILMEHYALIQLKKSSLSSTQRKMVEGKFNRMVEKNPNLKEEVKTRISFLKDAYGI